MNSCLYHGWVEHRRCTPREHKFRYRLWMAYLDLAELPELVGANRLIAGRKFAAASLLRGDHFGDATVSLDEAVRTEIARQMGNAPAGPIHMLTLLRQWGYYFSPLNLFYCFDTANQLECVLAEVSNTPWLETHSYVLGSGNRVADDRGQMSPKTQFFRHSKGFHVSPFMGMDAEYRWQICPPGDDLLLSIESRSGGEELFHARLAMQRKPLDRASLRRALIANPAVPLKVVTAIYWQAFRLWMKRCPFYPHPNRSKPTAG